MKPYYDEGGITIYHGDCREVLPVVAHSVGGVVSDPPYGIAYVGSPGTSNRKNLGPNAHYKGRRPLRTRETVANDDVDFDPAPYLQWPCAFTGAQHFYDRLPAGGSLHSWDKRGDYKRLTFADADFVWVSRKMNAQTFRLVWRGLCRHAEHDQRIEHPTQKPVALMQWIIGLLALPPTALLLDPYMGVGTTLVAAKMMGFPAIGIEMREDYCATAVKRLGQGVLFGRDTA